MSPSLEGATTRHADWGRPQIGWLSGERLHLQHGPIDLIIKLTGDAAACTDGYRAAALRFGNILGELVDELALLRQRVRMEQGYVSSPVAQRMVAACQPYEEAFITPMAAVAGAVSDDILAAIMAAAPELRRAYVNNGGDIAVHVAAGETLRIGAVADLAAAMPDGIFHITHDDQVGGIATSGWRGRSFSLGIADAVSVLARSAAQADAAATMIANAVNAQHPAIQRAPARSLDPDSDLGELLVTTDVGMLPADLVVIALDCGAATAAGLAARALIHSATMTLQGVWRLHNT
jgi:uncharacterized protein